MKVLMLAAGVVGIAAAYQLIKNSHDVTVVDRASEATSFTSFAYAGLIAPRHAYGRDLCNFSNNAIHAMPRKIRGGKRASTYIFKRYCSKSAARPVSRMTVSLVA